MHFTHIMNNCSIGEKPQFWTNVVVLPELLEIM